ncbi:MAG: hypothetical protein HUJ29_11765 [Gammaproteobacteria bacterium]|nr:hypothetical protein [Gammaproteobacteria bacterium]
MQGEFDFVTVWADMIGGVFADYLLAAVLVTLVSMFVYLYHYSQSGRHRLKTVLYVLLGWAIAVPLLGWLLKLLGTVFDIWVWLFELIATFPLMISATILVSMGLYWAWGRLPANPPSQALRAVTLVLLAIFFIASLPFMGQQLEVTEQDTLPTKNIHSP